MGTRTSGVPAAGIVPPELANACADVTLARQQDAVGCRQARYVAAPSSTAEAAALLAAAAELGLSVVPRGSASRLNWGAEPATCDLIVDTGKLDKVLEHAAGDLVVSIQAGVRLGDLAQVLATAGQRLALDPPGAADHGGTIGGLIATGVAGPLRFRYGSPRDLMIGITVVRADGTVTKSGGKVVKNVAGYDLGKLYAGSYGTLGLITEATFRLHPAPGAATWIALDCPDPAAATAVVQVMAGSPLAPAAIELDWPSAAAQISVAVLLEGDKASVADRAARMQDLLRNGTNDLRERTTDDQRSESSGTRLRVAFWVGQLASVLDAIRDSGAAAGIDPAVSGSAAAGVLQVEVSPDAAVDAVVGFIAALRAGLGGLAGPTGMPTGMASAVVLCAPASVRDSVDVWGSVPSLGLMRAIKDQFDPEHRMAPGRFAGGI